MKKRAQRRRGKTSRRTKRSGAGAVWGKVRKSAGKAHGSGRAERARRTHRSGSVRNFQKHPKHGGKARGAHGAEDPKRKGGPLECGGLTPLSASRLAGKRTGTGRFHGPSTPAKARENQGGVKPPQSKASPHPGGGNGAEGPPKPWRPWTAMRKRPGRKITVWLDVLPAPVHSNDEEWWVKTVAVVVASLIASVCRSNYAFEKRSGIKRQMIGQMLHDTCLPGFPTVARMTRTGQCTMTEFVAEIEARTLDALRQKA